MDYHNLCNYTNECASLNTNIPRPLMAKNTTFRNPKILTLIELLCFNLNQVITIDYQNQRFKGVLEYVGDTYIIIHDLKLQTKVLYFTNQITSINFDDDIRYTK